MRNRPTAFRVLFLGMLFLAIGCSKQETPGQGAPPAAKALFGQKCGVCHDLARVETRRETRETWAKIVAEMQAKKAGWISDAEAARIVDFLAAEHGRK